MDTREYHLGIDTSNYKTSVALVGSDRNIVFNLSEFLPVKQGERGLRQETAFFLHSERLPEMIGEVITAVSRGNVKSVSVSYAPRRQEGSYMPVFMAGVNAARIISGILDVPLYMFSHQEGHIESVMNGFDIECDDEFIFTHLSGGTTEFLRCSKTSDGYDTEVIGGTLDISVGQLLDRAGVKLGYVFPAGKYLDEIASSSELSEKPSKIKIADGFFNLSGTETQVMRAIDSSGDRIIPGLFMRISELLVSESAYLSDKYRIPDVYIAGGVAASKTIRDEISGMITGRDFNILFGDPVLSGDNAVGTALLGERKTNGAYRNSAE